MQKILCLILIASVQLNSVQAEFKMNFMPRQFPWNVIVENNEKRLCFGTIISADWVLATASCLYNKKTVQLYFGVTKMEEKLNYNTINGSTVMELDIDAASIHPEYQTFENNNLALIKLPKSLVFNDYIRPINLPQKKHVDEDFTDFGGVVTFISSATELSWNIVYIISNNNCSESYTGITDSILCGVKYSKTDKVKCDFTSGQPLLVYENNKWIQIGVGIYRHTQKCDETAPTGFERLTAHREWIRNVTGIDADKDNSDSATNGSLCAPIDEEDCVIECFITVVIFVLFAATMIALFKLYARHNNVNYFTLKI